MALAALVSLLLFPAVLMWMPASAVLDEPAERLAYVLPWTLLPILSLFAGIGFIAHHRFFDRDAIDGDNPTCDRTLTAARAYLQNTMEQVLFAIVVWLVLAVVAPLHWLSLIPVLACWFLFCRVLFAVGYSKGAPARAFGFAGTFYPTVLAMMAALYFWAS